MMTDSDSPDTSIDCWNHIGVWSQNERTCPKLKQFSHCRNCLVYIRAGRKKLDQPVPDYYGMEWVNQWLNQPNKTKLDKQQRLLIFRLGHEYFALPLIQINEVLRFKAPTPLPHSNLTVLRGVTHVRGELCLYVSLCGALAMPQINFANESDEKRMIYTSVAGQAVVFAVDVVHGIIEYQHDTLRPLPDSLHPQQRQFSQGMMMIHIKEHPHHVCVLDTERWQPMMDTLR